MMMDDDNKFTKPITGDLAIVTKEDTSFYHDENTPTYNVYLPLDDLVLVLGLNAEYDDEVRVLTRLGEGYVRMSDLRVVSLEQAREIKRELFLVSDDDLVGES